MARIAQYLGNSAMTTLLIKPPLFLLNHKTWSWLIDYENIKGASLSDSLSEQGRTYCHHGYGESTQRR